MASALELMLLIHKDDKEDLLERLHLEGPLEELAKDGFRPLGLAGVDLQYKNEYHILEELKCVGYLYGCKITYQVTCYSDGKLEVPGCNKFIYRFQINDPASGCSLPPEALNFLNTDQFNVPINPAGYLTWDSKAKWTKFDEFKSIDPKTKWTFDEVVRRVPTFHAYDNYRFAMDACSDGYKKRYLPYANHFKSMKLFVHGAPAYKFACLAPDCKAGKTYNLTLRTYNILDVYSGSWLFVV